MRTRVEACSTSVNSPWDEREDSSPHHLTPCSHLSTTQSSPPLPVDPLWPGPRALTFLFGHHEYIFEKLTHLLPNVRR